MIQIEGPSDFDRLPVPAAKILAGYDSNHRHAVYGDWTDELAPVAEMRDIEYRFFRDDSVSGGGQ